MQAVGLVPSRFGDASPLHAVAGGGLAGTALGYLTGTAIENLTPNGVLEPGKLRKRLAWAGGAMGTLPGMWLGAQGMRQWQGETSPWHSWLRPNVLFGGELKQAALTDEMNVSVPVDAFNRVVLTDPFLPVGVRSYAAGLMTTADQQSGNDGFITPRDIARVAVGMGAGYLQAYAAGKVLGGLAGLSPEVQQTLSQAGMFAGAVKSVLPGLFR
jgi:hypothetical protein